MTEAKNYVGFWMLVFSHEEAAHMMADAAIEKAMFGNVMTNVERVKMAVHINDCFERDRLRHSA